jgi:hypothetical protein
MQTLTKSIYSSLLLRKPLRKIVKLYIFLWCKTIVYADRLINVSNFTQNNILCYISIKRALRSRVHSSKHLFLIVVYLHSYPNNFKTTSDTERSTTINNVACTNLYVCNGLVTRPAASITGRNAAQPICLPTSRYSSQDLSLADKLSIKKRRKKKEYRRNNTYCSRSVSKATLCLKRE